MSDDDSQHSLISDTIIEDSKPKKLGLKKHKKIEKHLNVLESDDNDEDGGETIYSEERSDDDESIGSLVDFIVQESSSPKSNKLEDIEEDETKLLIQDAKVFLGDENLELNSKVKNGRVLRGNPKTTETQRQYWTRRIVYLQCLDDLASKAWKNRAKELGITNLKQNMPERVDINGNICDEKWNDFTNFYNELKEKLFGDLDEETESSCDEDDDDFTDSDELLDEENKDDDDDEDEDEDEEDDDDEDENDEEEDDEDEEDENDEETEDENKENNNEVLEEDKSDDDTDDVYVHKKPKLN